MLEEEAQELRALSAQSKDARAPVTLDQQSVGRLSRMDAMQQQSMDLAREERRQLRIKVIEAAIKRIDDDDFYSLWTIVRRFNKSREEKTFRE